MDAERLQNSRREKTKNKLRYANVFYLYAFGMIVIYMRDQSRTMHMKHSHSGALAAAFLFSAPTMAEPSGSHSCEHLARIMNHDL